MSSITALDEATTYGVSGKLFSGKKIRDFQGALLEAQGISRESGKATNLALGFVEEPAFDCVNWAVCTTIFTPSDSIHEVCKHLKDYCLVTVADKKTPLNFTVRGECTFINLSVKKQEELQMHSTFALQTPWNHFGRKNLGYLYAIANGAKFIWDFDDDNKILSAEHFLNVANNFQNSLLTVDVNETTLNPYPLFGAETFSWPRGFPLQDIKNPSQQPVKAQLLRTVLKTGERIGVIQALANVDPDVDAIYRLQRKIPFDFVGARKSDVFLVPHQSSVPWNAQATMFSTRAALWATYLPMSVHGRVSDIWRSYITQRLFQNICMRTAFAMDPLVVQNRNPHSYLADFDAEQDLYYKSGKLVELLSSWTPATNTLDTQILELYILLYERDYVGIRDVQMIQLWLKELNLFNYQFPTACLNTALKDNRTMPAVTTGCDLRGEQFRCEPEIYAGNKTYAALVVENYAGNKTYAALVVENKQGKMDLWNSWLHNNSWKPRRQNMVMKVVLMTKDEWPILKSWVFYHGEMLGFNNLYIIDASENHECITFLTEMRENFEVNVIFSKSDLNNVLKDINYVMTKISTASDLMIKLDTDEFLAVLPDTELCKSLSTNITHGDCLLTPYGVLEYLREELADKMDGSLLKVGYYSAAISNQSMCDSFDDARPLYGDIPLRKPHPTRGKTFFDSRTYRAVDLGSHKGRAWKPFNTIDEHPYLVTKLGIIHLHSICFEAEMKNSARAVISHGYVSAEDTDLERVEKLYKLIDFPPCQAGPTECCAALARHYPTVPPTFVSIHKVFGYLNYLVCHEESKQNYYKIFAGKLANTNQLFKKYLEESTLF